LFLAGDTAAAQAILVREAARAEATPARASRLYAERATV
jgi:hypothetical protein